MMGRLIATNGTVPPPSLNSGKAKLFRARIKLPGSADPDGTCPALSISWDDGNFFVYAAVRINEGSCS